MPDQQSIHHTTGVHVRGLVWGALGIVGGIGFALAVAWWAWTTLGPKSAAPSMRIPAPRLETAPQPDRRAYDAEKQRVTQSTEWLDRRAGIARIPVEDAMQILAAHPEARK